MMAGQRVTLRYGWVREDDRPKQSTPNATGTLTNTSLDALDGHEVVQVRWDDGFTSTIRSDALVPMPAAMVVRHALAS